MDLYPVMAFLGWVADVGHYINGDERRLITALFLFLLNSAEMLVVRKRIRICGST